MWSWNRVAVVLMVAGLLFGCPGGDDEGTTPTAEPDGTPTPEVRTPTALPVATSTPTPPRETPATPWGATDTPSALETPWTTGTPGATGTPGMTETPWATETPSVMTTPRVTPTPPASLVDQDGDGYPASVDCDDSVETVNPGAEERCNGVDDDCDGVVDDDPIDPSTYYLDADGDGYGAFLSPVVGCSAPEGHVDNGDDCDDTTAAVYPGAPELCDGVDNDCDQVVDEELAEPMPTWYPDEDGDGYGAVGDGMGSCVAVEGMTLETGDCDDTDPAIYPGATEVCDADVPRDNDCDGEVDEAGAAGSAPWYPDEDEDGYGAESGAVDACSAPDGYVGTNTDCDDTDPTIHPGAPESCDEGEPGGPVDNDCDGEVNEDDAVDAPTWYLDADRDGFGTSDQSISACAAPDGYVADDTDCDDTDEAVHPGAVEVCDGDTPVDNDCNGFVDDNAEGATLLAFDGDGDGFGAAGSFELRCQGVDNDLDCDDDDPSEPRVAEAGADYAGADGSLVHPFPTIQDAVEAAAACVVVLPGTYYEAVDLGDRSLSLVGEAGPGETIIDASGHAAPALTIGAADVAAPLVKGFTILGGEGDYEVTETSYTCGSTSVCLVVDRTYSGGGIYVKNAQPTLENLIVKTNTLPPAEVVADGNDTYYTWSFGGGLCVVDGLVIVDGVDFIDNYADQGGAIYIDETSSVKLYRSRILGNGAGDGGGIAVSGGVLRMANVLSAWNEADEAGGGLVATGANVTAENVTWGFETSTVAAVDMSESGHLVLRNSIVYATAGGSGVVVSLSSTLEASYNDVYGNETSQWGGQDDPTGVNGNISADPLFIDVTENGDPLDDDWHLAAGSPCIDAGDPAPSQTDVDGTRNDMGAYGGPDGDWTGRG